MLFAQSGGSHLATFTWLLRCFVSGGTGALATHDCDIVTMCSWGTNINPVMACGAMIPNVQLGGSARVIGCANSTTGLSGDALLGALFKVPFHAHCFSKAGFHVFECDVAVCSVFETFRQALLTL